MACRKGSLEIVKFLIEKGAEVNAQNVGRQTPLHLATIASHAEIVIHLLDHGVDHKIKDKEGHTAFEMAKFKPNLTSIFKFRCIHE